jgi:hypothetical protein
MKNCVFWDELGTTLAVTSNRRTLRRNVYKCICKCILCSVYRLLVTANAPSSPTLVALMTEALNSYETSVLTRATRRKIREDAILHSHRRENLKSYIVVPNSLILFTLVMDATYYSETSVLTRVTQRHTPEDDILQSYLCENLESYINSFCL